jgi:hypothetical protein
MIRKVVHFALAVALVVTGTGLTGRVLCVGASGHYEIEVRDAACCGARTVADAPSLQARCSDGCTDTPIALTAISQKNAHLTTVFFPVSTVPVGGDTVESAWRASWSPSRQSPPPRPPRLLGTAVHLC